jgi:hypothetical protein
MTAQQMTDLIRQALEVANMDVSVEAHALTSLWIHTDDDSAFKLDVEQAA